MKYTLSVYVNSITALDIPLSVSGKLRCNAENPVAHNILFCLHTTRRNPHKQEVLPVQVRSTFSGTIPTYILVVSTSCEYIMRFQFSIIHHKLVYYWYHTLRYSNDHKKYVRITYLMWGRQLGLLEWCTSCLFHPCSKHSVQFHRNHL